MYARVTPLILIFVGLPCIAFSRGQSKYWNYLLQTVPLSPSSDLDIGKSLAAGGHFREAFPFLKRALDANPGDGEAQRAMAHALVELRQFFQAEALLKKLTDSNPKDGESWYYLGLLMYRNGYFGAALPALDKSLAYRPGNVTALVYRAVSLAKVGRTKEAESAFVQLSANATAQRDPDFLLVYAELLDETGRDDLALKQVDRAVDVMPETPIAYFWRARILFRLGRTEEAAKAAERSIEIAPQLPFARSLLLQIYRKLHRMAEAAQQADWLREYEARMNQSRQP